MMSVPAATHSPTPTAMARRKFLRLASAGAVLVGGALAAAAAPSAAPSREPVQWPTWLFRGQLVVAPLKRRRGTFRGVKIREAETQVKPLWRRPAEPKDGQVTFYIQQPGRAIASEQMLESLRRLILSGGSEKGLAYGGWLATFLLAPDGAAADPLILSLSREEPWVMISGSYTVAEEIYQDDPEAAPTLIGRSEGLYRALQTIGKATG